MVAQRNIRRFAQKLDDGTGAVWSTKGAKRDSGMQSSILDVTQKFSGFDEEPADSPKSWWQRRKSMRLKQRAQSHQVAAVKQETEDDQMPKKSTKEKLHEIFNARSDDDDEREEDDERDDDYEDDEDDRNRDEDAENDNDEDEDEEGGHQRQSKQAKMTSLSSKQSTSRQEKRLNSIGADIKKKKQELAKLMKEEHAERAEIKRQEKEFEQQRKALDRDAQDKGMQGLRHPIAAGFLMAVGFVLFFVLIAGIIFSVMLMTGRPFSEFIRLVIKV